MRASMCVCVYVFVCMRACVFSGDDSERVSWLANYQWFIARLWEYVQYITNPSVDD